MSLAKWNWEHGRLGLHLQEESSRSKKEHAQWAPWIEKWFNFRGTLVSAPLNLFPSLFPIVYRNMGVGGTSTHYLRPPDSFWTAEHPYPCDSTSEISGGAKEVEMMFPGRDWDAEYSSNPGASSPVWTGAVFWDIFWGFSETPDFKSCLGSPDLAFCGQWSLGWKLRFCDLVCLYSLVGSEETVYTSILELRPGN